MTWLEVMAAVGPPPKGKGTVSPAAMPITTSRTASEPVKCCSMCGVAGMRCPSDMMAHRFQHGDTGGYVELQAQCYRIGLALVTASGHKPPRRSRPGGRSMSAVPPSRRNFVHRSERRQVPIADSCG